MLARCPHDGVCCSGGFRALTLVLDQTGTVGASKSHTFNMWATPLCPSGLM